jgi:hypothetical protein
MMSFRGQASWAKMMSPGGKLTALACHPTKRVNKVEELTSLSTNIDKTHKHNNYLQLISKKKIFHKSYLKCQAEGLSGDISAISPTNLRNAQRSHHKVNGTKDPVLFSPTFAVKFYCIFLGCNFCAEHHILDQFC